MEQLTLATNSPNPSKTFSANFLVRFGTCHYAYCSHDPAKAESTPGVFLLSYLKIDLSQKKGIKS